MPSLPHSNDPLDPFALLVCDGCGRDAFILRPVLWDNITMLLCDTCYGDGEAERPTEPTLPAVTTLPSVYWHEGLPINELPGCEPCPEENTYCAASYLAYLEQSGNSVVPAGDPVLCPAHWVACWDDVVRIYPQLSQAPERIAGIVRLHGQTYMQVATVISARIADRLESR